MKRLVIKFGGTSLMDTRRIQKAAEIVMSNKASGVDVIVVVSAMGHTTDNLLELSKDLTASPDLREIDALISTGEQVSASLMAIALRSLGGAARSFTGQSAGITTDNHFGNAKIKTIRKEALEVALREQVIPVVAGFQGITDQNEVTTLGRGGSDTTAIALATVLHADCCDIYSDVRGIYSADPNILDRAYMLDAISYAEMLELAKNGAQVLNDRSVQIAMEHQVKVRVRSTFLPNDTGTLVTNHASQINAFTSIATVTKKNCIKVQLSAANCKRLQDKRALRHERTEWKRILLRLLFNAGISVEPGSSLKNCPNEFSFSLGQNDTQKAIAVLKQAMPSMTNDLIVVEEDLAKVSVVGGRLDSAFEVDAILGLTKAGVPISIVTRAKNRLSIFVPEEYKHQALGILHANCCVLAKVAA
ncbi:MAG: aspartate kinase [Candidatus Obscuribacterales bacterium]|nr:aspartate kinase [Candidatus Obscuribacterales bacterium]